MSEWWGQSEDAADVDIEAILLDVTIDEDGKRQKLHQVLVDAAQNGSENVVREILGDSRYAGFVDVNQKDASGSNALIYTSIFGHEGAASELLRFGALTDVQDQNEYTPLMWAVQNQHLAIVQRLVENGADSSIATSSGRSVASLVQPGSAIATYLVANGVDLNDEGDDDFYKPAQDPRDIEDHFTRQVEESSAALGLNIASVPTNDLELPMSALDSFNLSLSEDFDWDRYHVEQSFVLNSRKIPFFLDLVVTKMRPTLKRQQLPISANAIFLVLRYFHYNGPQDAVVNLMNPLGRRVLNAVDEQKHDLSYASYWLANIEILLYYIRRDPGVNEGTAKDFQPALEELFETLTSIVISITRELLEPLVRPCLLDYENIPGLDSIQYRGDWKIFNRNKKYEEPTSTTQFILPPSLEALKKPAPRKFTAVLSSLLLVLDVFNVHPVTIQLIYSQLFYWLGSSMFNSIMNNRKYLARARAMQIRLNLSSVEDWCRNNNRRPTSGEEYGGIPTYKSLVELGRAHFSSAAEMLQWLQIFSGFGSDFTNVIAALQELRSLNPRQLLYAAKNYRSEVNEPSLSKDYKFYLQELAAHHDTQIREDAKTKEEAERAAKLEKQTATKLKDSGESSAEPHDSPKEVESAPAPATAPGPEPEPESSASERDSSAIALKTPIITSKEVFMDASLVLTLFAPTLREMVVFWGGGLGGMETHSPHYMVPSVPAELADILDANTGSEPMTERTYESVDMPQATQNRRDDEYEAENGWGEIGAQPSWG